MPRTRTASLSLSLTKSIDDTNAKIKEGFSPGRGSKVRARVRVR